MVGAQTFSRYNLFYRLERILLLHERGAAPTKKEGAPSEDDAKRKYAGLNLPPLPSRYDGVDIPELWFLSSKASDKKRSHRKTHGVASFTEIARIVASNWKSIDADTMAYVTLVSGMLTAHAKEHGISTSQPKTKKRKSVDGEQSKKKVLDALLCPPVPKSLDAPCYPMPLTFPGDSLASSVHSMPTSTDNRSKTPQVSDGLLGSNLILPSIPMSNYSNDLNSVEQNFLSHVLGANAVKTNEFGQPQTVSSLLTRMSSNGAPVRRASLPGCMPCSMPPGDAELKRLLPFAQRRRASVVSTTSSQGSGFAQRRRASVESTGSGFARSCRASVESTISQVSCQSEPAQARAVYRRSESLPVRELDISDEDILGMWSE